MSELDVKDMVDFETQKELCASTSESCASQLAGAYDARLVLFLNLYVVTSETHAQVTLLDLETGAVVHRSDATGVDDRKLSAAVRTEVREALAVFNTNQTRTRLFVSRATASGAIEEVREATSTPVLVGGVMAAGGGLVAISGLIAGLIANSVVADESSTGDNKASAQTVRAVAYVGVGIGALAFVIGGVAVIASGAEL